MKRLTLTLGLVSCALLACEESGDRPALTAPKARSQAVVTQARDPRPAPSAVRGPAAASSVHKAAPRQALCAGQLGDPGKPLSTSSLPTRAASGAPTLPDGPRVGQGAWTWLNFWAAWCVPCREEIPRLKRWAKELAASGRFRLSFISLDDDARQLMQFLEGQPEGGLRQSYWIEEGDQRQEWFAALALDPDPELPLHILVDPKGLARCVVNGAVEDGDLPALRKIVGAE